VAESTGAERADSDVIGMNTDSANRFNLRDMRLKDSDKRLIVDPSLAKRSEESYNKFRKSRTMANGINID